MSATTPAQLDAALRELWAPEDGTILGGLDRGDPLRGRWISLRRTHGYSELCALHVSCEPVRWSNEGVEWRVAVNLGSQTCTGEAVEVLAAVLPRYVQVWQTTRAQCPDTLTTAVGS